MSRSLGGDGRDEDRDEGLGRRDGHRGGRLSASAAELSGAPTPGPAKEEGSAQAQIWFERALSLDIGAAGAPDAVQAFAAMRHAAEFGHTQAAFNVAVMLDSGRGARATWCKLPSGMRGRLLAATVAPPSISASSMKAARACPQMSICLALGMPRPICPQLANTWRKPGLRLFDQRLFRRRAALSLNEKLACARPATSRSRLVVAS